ncbi:MAG: ATP:cob(I)alamin adenosyltransferase [Deltaproteobacteria bacterium CG11_big_fil_rev_8_21_14_0_20_47_16]|nr:MAG: ATP:cob(I)alamin adenosyltransferase [Deltaproteobacteria bacterium CG11_big_fil_rev_8_21_14_0_20_47_16]
MSIVTRVGDKGTTKLFTGTTVSKHSLRIETYGTVDELCAQMGLARSLSQVDIIKQILHAVQHTSFQLGAELATDDASKAPFKVEPITAAHVAEIDGWISQIEPSVKLPPSFIIPGGTTASAAIDVARTTCRRAERRVVAMVDEGESANKELVRYMNRLSDLLFLLARLEEQKAGVTYDKVSGK